MKKIIETIKLEEGITVELLKEQLDELKKTDSYFFEKKASGYEPVNPEGDKGDGDGEVSMAANFAKEANKSESQETKSQFFN